MRFMSVAFLSILVLHYACGQEPYKLCVSQSQSHPTDCEALKGTDSEVKCVSTVDSADCALKLKTGEADFGVFNPEQIVLSATNLDKSARIIHQVVRNTDPSVEYKFQTVVVVKKDFSGGLAGMKGKKYCHPGFKERIWNDRVLKVFESKVVTMECDSEKRPAVEDEIYSIAKTFPEACRPGRWTVDTAEDIKLQTRYSQLCVLCEDKSTCSNNPEKGNHHAGALKCLTQSNGGDVAYVNLLDAQDYFSSNPTLQLQYRYLCMNGTTVNINVSKPCAWYQEPFDVVLARKELSADLQVKLTGWLKTLERGINWKYSLKELILMRDENLSPLNATPSNYVSAVSDGISKEDCTSNIKWCTTSSLENEKCESLKLASALRSIKPRITCVQADSKWECLKRVQDGNADIMAIDTDLSFLATKHYNLDTMMYLDPSTYALYVSVAVVKDGTAEKLGDLKDKNGCFPEFGGLAYISLLETLRTQSIQREACPYKNTMGSFFSKTCIPEADEKTHDPDGHNDAKELCSLCPKGSCSVEGGGSYLNDARALKCLVNGGDVAFINANSLPEIRKNPALVGNFSESQYRFLCKDGGLLPLSSTVNHTCALATLLRGQVVGRSSLSEFKKMDVKFALLKMDELFGSAASGAFKMYSTYNGVEDLLFKGETAGLADENNKYVTAFEDTMRSSTQCFNNGFVATVSTMTLMLVVSMAMFTTRIY